MVFHWGSLYPAKGFTIAVPCGSSNVEGIESYNTLPPSKLYHAVQNPFLPSKIQGEIAPVVKVPARIVNDNDHGVQSFKRAIAQYKPHKDFDFSLEVVYEDVKQMFVEAETDLEFKSKRSDREAVTGIEGKVKHIDMNTSAGIPWALSKDLKEKKKLLIHDEDNNFLGYEPTFAEHLRREMQMMEDKITVPTVFQISHKPELLANPEKVRIIQGSPLTYTVHMRQYFMDFNYAFQYDRENLEHRIGMNVYGTEWDAMARRLLRKGSKILVGDYSKFGPRLYTPFVEKSYEIMREWYNARGGSKEDDAIREQLSIRAVDNYNMAYKELFKLKCGSPSGAINTAIINSMCNTMYFRTAWLGIMKESKPEWATMHAFKENVELIVYGDDVIASITDEAIEYFDNRKIHEFFAKYDIKYTDIIKDGEIRPYCSIHEATFLQEGFHLFEDTTALGGLWISKPVEENIKNIINWIRKPKGISIIEAKEKEEILALKVNCETAIRLHWFLGRDKFEEFQTLVRRKIKERFGRKFMPTYYTFVGLQQELGIPEDKMNEDVRANIIGATNSVCGPAQLTAHVFYENENRLAALVESCRKIPI